MERDGHRYDTISVFHASRVRNTKPIQTGCVAELVSVLNMHILRGKATQRALNSKSNRVGPHQFKPIYSEPALKERVCQNRLCTDTRTGRPSQDVPEHGNEEEQSPNAESFGWSSGWACSLNINGSSSLKKRT